MSDLPPLEHLTVRPAGVELHVVQAGDPAGPLALLLHGFPEFWYGWRHQIRPLVEAGYRVWIPDQRGYAVSGKPPRVRDYRQEQLTADALGLIDAAERERAVVIGHDWGGVVAWWLALLHPERVERLAVLNIPHPLAFQRALRTARQLRRSWYIGFFQLPWLPERWLRADGFRRLRSTLVGMSRPGAFTERDLERYVEAWSQPRALWGGLAWYRAAVRHPPLRLPTKRVTVPTLLIWGAGDTALGEEMAEPSIALCDRGELVRIPEAGHFVAADAPDRVNTELLRFLRGS